MLHLRPFRRSDYSAYRRWFEDTWLNRALGPLDETWLEYVLSETDGAQYAAFQDEELVAVTGVVWGDFHHPYQVVTDLAVGLCPLDRLCQLRQSRRASVPPPPRLVASRRSDSG